MSQNLHTQRFNIKQKHIKIKINNYLYNKTRALLHTKNYGYISLKHYTENTKIIIFIYSLFNKNTTKNIYYSFSVLHCYMQSCTNLCTHVLQTYFQLYKIHQVTSIKSLRIPRPLFKFQCAWFSTENHILVL